jgi:hypothetical protein
MISWGIAVAEVEVKNTNPKKGGHNENNLELTFGSFCMA